jgi:hypothetical protein
MAARCGQVGTDALDHLGHLVAENPGVGGLAGDHGEHRPRAGRRDEQQRVVELADDLPHPVGGPEPGAGTARQREQAGRDGGQVIGTVVVEPVRGLAQPVGRQEQGAPGVRNAVGQAGQEPDEVLGGAYGIGARQVSRPFLGEG